MRLNKQTFLILLVWAFNTEHNCAVVPVSDKYYGNNLETMLF